MKILLNTNYDSVVTRATIDNIGSNYKKLGYKFVFNDWINYSDFDLIMFLAPDSEVMKAKKQNPNALIGIMDPKAGGGEFIKEAKNADFLAVSSIEQADFFRKYSKNIIIHHWFPDVKPFIKEHKQKSKIIIGYQGNKIHLSTFYPHLQKALDCLSEKYTIEFYAIYDIKKLGKWQTGVPKKIKVHHIQWNINNYCNYLKECDIGVVPAFIPINRQIGLLATKIFSKNIFAFGHDKNDYLLRFKYPTNPNRIYEFCQLGIPIVSDMFPSACQFIKHGESGFLVNSKEGWYDALEYLIMNREIRNIFSINLRKFVDKNYSREKNFNNFNNFIEKLKESK